jgi:hypothetical protein
LEERAALDARTAAAREHGVEAELTDTASEVCAAAAMEVELGQQLQAWATVASATPEAHGPGIAGLADCIERAAAIRLTSEQLVAAVRREMERLASEVALEVALVTRRFH